MESKRKPRKAWRGVKDKTCLLHTSQFLQQSPRADRKNSDFQKSISEEFHIFVLLLCTQLLKTVEGHKKVCNSKNKWDLQYIEIIKVWSIHILWTEIQLSLCSWENNLFQEMFPSDRAQIWVKSQNPKPKYLTNWTQPVNKVNPIKCTTKVSFRCPNLDGVDGCQSPKQKSAIFGYTKEWPFSWFEARKVEK